MVLPCDLYRSLNDRRDLPGIDFDVKGQLALAAQLNYRDELLQLPLEKSSAVEFGFHNDSFESGDAEILYDFVRHFKPRRILEVGSGQSTLIARLAIAKNLSQNPNYACEHVCIEPYEQPWLESLDIKIIRKRVELCPMSHFESLESGDILFIDSSHVLRPQGDVVHLYLSVLPRLRPGVIVHVHDVFTPRDYPEDWVLKARRLWDEQYILEAFLSFNDRFKVLMSLNMMALDHRDALKDACPILQTEPDRMPGSFWFQRVS
jgi:predicted O-methyltransferase YrrM